MNLFEWDPAKAAINLRKHGIAFEDLDLVFEGPIVTQQDLRKDYGEERWRTLGFLFDMPVVIVHTRRGDSIRIISARRAGSYETEKYFKIT
jgi:uncharacterized DUF497 family protein